MTYSIYLATASEATLHMITDRYYTGAADNCYLPNMSISMLLHGVTATGIMISLHYHCSCIDLMIAVGSSLGRGAKARAQ